MGGDAERVRAVLCQGVADWEARDEQGSKAFIGACWSGSAVCIRLLAEAGCDKDVVTDNGDTALMWAALTTLLRW